MHANSFSLIISYFENPTFLVLWRNETNKISSQNNLQKIYHKSKDVIKQTLYSLPQSQSQPHHIFLSHVFNRKAFMRWMLFHSVHRCTWCICQNSPRLVTHPVQSLPLLFGVFFLVYCMAQHQITQYKFTHQPFQQQLSIFRI